VGAEPRASDKVAEVLSQWLGAIDYEQRDEVQDDISEQQSENEKREAKQFRKLSRPSGHREEGGQGWPDGNAASYKDTRERGSAPPGRASEP